MGCECAKPRYSRISHSIELRVSEYEDLLGYSKHNSVAIWGELRATTDTFLSRRQFLDYLTNLSLNKEGFDSPTRPLHRFYSFYRSNNAYDKRKLAILGLLLGHGTAQSKIDIIYQMHNTEELKHSELERVFREMLSVASVELPSYAQYWMEVTSEPEDTLKISKYREKLAIAIPDTVQMFLHLIISTSETLISKDNCKSRLKGELAQSLFIARNLRMLSIDVYKRGKKERERRREAHDRDIVF